jgi:putative glycosyltransferase (TIGR04348 family)
MNITIITPARPVARSGNRNTAVRWATLLRELGHRVRVEMTWNGKPTDLMLALHARRSHASIARFKAAHPGRPLVLALTGTDLYRDIRTDRDARESMRLADRMIVLQDMGPAELEPALRAKTRVIYQSTRGLPRQKPLRSCFEVVVSGHLREEKDPFRTAAALAFLPETSHIRATHIGGAMSDEMKREAENWMQREPRYRWRGEYPHHRALRIQARARLLVISSRMEGGANVVTEALAAGIPVLASRIPGNVGMLGRNYAGYFELGNARSLAHLLNRSETEPAFLEKLRRQCAARRPLVSRTRERSALRALLAECRALKSRRRR